MILTDESQYFCLDANILIEGWNKQYRIDLFPTLWQKISEHIDRLILLDVIYKEVHQKPLAGKKLTSAEIRESTLCSKAVGRRLVYKN